MIFLTKSKGKKYGKETNILCLKEEPLNNSLM
jgi:hypothetical protein